MLGDEKGKIKSAYEKLFTYDRDLLLVDANERSITHRLAVYLEQMFPGWDVDCEYNRNGQLPKKLYDMVEDIKSDNTEGATVYPDIIIHKRTTGSNYIVIEVKKINSSVGRDREKLIAYKKELNYQHAFFIQIPVKDGMNEEIEPEKLIESIE